MIAKIAAVGRLFYNLISIFEEKMCPKIAWLTNSLNRLARQKIQRWKKASLWSWASQRLKVTRKTIKSPNIFTGAVAILAFHRKSQIYVRKCANFLFYAELLVLHRKWTFYLASETTGRDVGWTTDVICPCEERILR